MKIYCVKCRKQTDTKHLKNDVTANGRPCVKGQCAICGTNKTRFVGGASKRKSKQKGEGFFNDLLNSNKLPEMHYWSPFSGKKFSFAGPFTKLDKRLDPKTKLPLAHSKPVNDVDKAAYYHDLAYENMKDMPSRRVADNVMIEDLDAIRRDKKTDWRTRGDAFLVGLAMKTKRLLGLGKKRRRK